MPGTTHKENMLRSPSAGRSTIDHFTAGSLSFKHSAMALRNAHQKTWVLQAQCREITFEPEMFVWHQLNKQPFKLVTVAWG